MKCFFLFVCFSASFHKVGFSNLFTSSQAFFLFFSFSLKAELDGIPRGTLSYTSLFSQFRNQMLSRAELVGKNNVCMMFFDDLTDLENQPTFWFFRTLADNLASYKNKGAFCEFRYFPEIQTMAPVFEGMERNLFSFFNFGCSGSSCGPPAHQLWHVG